MSTDGMETKQVPGYVPAPLVNPDVVERPAEDEGANADKAADEKSAAKIPAKGSASK